MLLNLALLGLGLIHSNLRMFESYHLFSVHLFLSILVMAGIIFYKYFFPKKNPNLLILLIIISILPTISIFRIGAYESGDFILHIYRAMDFYRSLSEGNIIPSWAGNLNAHFGYPLFIFINPLPYYILSFFHLLGFSFIASMKLFLATSFILSGIFMYLFARKLLDNSLAAFTAAIVYLFSPYHLIDLHFRVTVGEITTFMTLPLLFYAIVRLSKKTEIKNVAFLSIAYALNIASHQVFIVFTTILSVSFILILTFANKNRAYSFLAGAALSYSIGILMAASTLFPYLYYGQFTKAVFEYSMFFTSLHELLYTPYRFGLLYQGPNGEIRTSLGYIQWIIAIIALFYFFKKGKFLSHLRFWTTAFYVLIFMILPISHFVWTTIPYLKLAAVSYRLLLPATFVVSIIGGLLTLNLKNKAISYMLVIAVIGFSLLNWGQRTMLPTVTDEIISQELPKSSAGVEGWNAAVPKWQDNLLFEEDIPATRLQVENALIIESLFSNSTSHRYRVSVDQKSNAIHNTWYFPGWQVFVDNSAINILNPSDSKGLISFMLSKGNHVIEIKYEDLEILKYVRAVSLFFLISALAIILLSNCYQLKRHLLFGKFSVYQLIKRLGGPAKR